MSIWQSSQSTLLPQCKVNTHGISGGWKAEAKSAPKAAIAATVSAQRCRLSRSFMMSTWWRRSVTTHIRLSQNLHIVGNRHAAGRNHGIQLGHLGDEGVSLSLLRPISGEHGQLPSTLTLRFSNPVEGCRRPCVSTAASGGGIASMKSTRSCGTRTCNEVLTSSLMSSVKSSTSSKATAKAPL